MFSEFSYDLKYALNYSKKEMLSLKHSYIGTEHVVLAILSFDNEINRILNNYGIYYDDFKNKIIEYLGKGKEDTKLFVFTPLLKRIIDNLIFYSNENKLKEISLSNFFSSMIELGEGVAYRLFLKYDLDINELYSSFRSSNNVIDTTSLNELGIDITSKEYLIKMNPVIGRDEEVERIIEIVMKKNKCNPLLIGEAGVGKTSIVEEFARRIVNLEVPIKLYNYKVFSLSMASLVSGTKYRGEFEEKVLKIVKYAEDNNVILFIDEIHTLVGAGGAEGAIDASNILKPALARGNMIVIGATTVNEYKKYIEIDKALVRRFDLIEVKEPKKEEVLKIINGIKPKYEEYHNVILNKDITKYIIEVSNKYFYYKKEPDRTIDFLDEICSYVSSSLNKEQLNNIELKKELANLELYKNQAIKDNNFNLAKKYREKERRIESLINCNDIVLFSKNKKKKITTDIVNKVLSRKCGVNINSNKNIKSVLENQKRELKRYIIGQNNVIDEVVESTKFVFDSELNINKPISIIFNGPTGVGKKYLSTLLGKKIFNNNYHYIDLSNIHLDEESLNIILKKSNNKPFYLYIFDNCNTIINTIIKNKIDNKENDLNKNTLFIFINNNNKESIGFNNQNYPLTKKINFNKLTIIDIKRIIRNNLESKSIHHNSIIIKNILNKIQYDNYGLSKMKNIIDQYLLNEKLIV